MRVIGEIQHPHCKITLFNWNNRYLVKLEQGPLEQTFKINQYDLSGEADLQSVVNPAFINEALTRFAAMEASLHKALSDL